MLIGKVVGSVLGLAYGGFPGLFLGFFLGHFLDKKARMNIPYSFTNPENIKQTQNIFFFATFSVMGHIAKADGRVSQTDIQAARHIMKFMRLNQQQISQAVKFFTYGKKPSFDLHEALNKLISSCHHNRPLLHTFIEIQFQAANFSGLTPHKKVILQTLCQRLGFAPMFAWEYAGSSQYDNTNNQDRTSTITLNDAYQLLGVNSSSDKSDIKKKYRKLMSQYHPDKLISKGLPEEMMKIATTKTQKIKAAYDVIKKEHRF